MLLWLPSERFELILQLRIRLVTFNQKAMDFLPKNGTPFEIYRSLLKKTNFQHYRNLCLSDSAKISLVIVTQIYFSLRFKAIC